MRLINNRKVDLIDVSKMSRVHYNSYQSSWLQK